MYGYDVAAHGVAAPGQPAAGGGFTYKVPHSETQFVLAVCFKLVNAVAVAARLVTLTLLDGTGVPIAVASAGFTTASGVTSRFTFAVGITAYGANDAAAIGAPLPPVWLVSGQSVVAAIANANAADQLSDVRVSYAQSGTAANADDEQ